MKERVQITLHLNSMFYILYKKLMFGKVHTFDPIDSLRKLMLASSSFSFSFLSSISFSASIRANSFLENNVCSRYCVVTQNRKTTEWNFLKKKREEKTPFCLISPLIYLFNIYSIWWLDFFRTFIFPYNHFYHLRKF